MIPELWDSSGQDAVFKFSLALCTEQRQHVNF